MFSVAARRTWSALRLMAKSRRRAPTALTGQRFLSILRRGTPAPGSGKVPLAQSVGSHAADLAQTLRCAAR